MGVSGDEVLGGAVSIVLATLMWFRIVRREDHTFVDAMRDEIHRLREDREQDRVEIRGLEAEVDRLDHENGDLRKDLNDERARCDRLERAIRAAGIPVPMEGT